jgi:hypothetical protein
MAELLPWLNLLLIPIAGAAFKASAVLVRLETIQLEHARRLGKLESDFGELREVRQ